MSSPSEAPTTEKPRAIVIGHGDFAAGMRSAVQKITGRGGALIALSGQDLSLPQIEETLRAALQANDVSVVFTDLQAGSATMAARRILRNLPGGVLVVGANLPMLLDFVLSTSTSAREAAEHAATRGSSCIAVYGGGVPDAARDPK
jgi:mannose/fructose-specific phosphotransferase system component IIA